MVATGIQKAWRQGMGGVDRLREQRVRGGMLKSMETDNAQVSRGPRAGRAGFVMLGRIQGMPGWADDPMLQQV